MYRKLRLKQTSLMFHKKISRNSVLHKAGGRIDTYTISNELVFPVRKDTTEAPKHYMNEI